MVEKYDVAIIGAGPGGYVAALRAAQLGFKTLCVDERLTLGGTCLNVGCIPSKSLLRSTEMLEWLKREGKENGIECSELKVNFSQIMARKNKIVKSLVEGIEGLFHQHQITALQGTCEFVDTHHLKISQKNGLQKDVEASYILIATGSESIELPDLPFDERQIVSSTGALNLLKIPRRLLVIGGGVIGVELASVYARLGSQVIVIEMLDRICAPLDKSLSHSLLQSLKKQGIDFQLSTQMVAAVIQPEEVILTVNQQNKLHYQNGDVVLVAVGRRPYTKNLQLDRIGIQLNKKGFIPIDGNFCTIHPHIYAIGDVIEGPMLAHRASAEAVAVIESLKGERVPFNYLSIPNVVYTDPEAAFVGLTEEEAKKTNLTLIIGKSFFRGNSRARCNGETDGYVKIIGDKRSGRLLGMHILGSHASEMIHEGMLAIQKKATVSDIANACHAHPTLSEAIKEAALDALEKPLHQ